MGISLWLSVSDKQKPYFLNIVLLFLKYSSTRWNFNRLYTLSSSCQRIFPNEVISVFLLYLFPCSLLQLMASPASAAQVRQLSHLTLQASSSCLLRSHPHFCFLCRSVCWFWFLPLDYHYPTLRVQGFIMDSVDYNSPTSFPAPRTSNSKAHYTSLS